MFVEDDIFDIFNIKILSFQNVLILAIHAIFSNNVTVDKIDTAVKTEIFEKTEGFFVLTGRKSDARRMAMSNDQGVWTDGREKSGNFKKFH